MHGVHPCSIAHFLNVQLANYILKRCFGSMIVPLGKAITSIHSIVIVWTRLVAFERVCGIEVDSLQFNDIQLNSC